MTVGQLPTPAELPAPIEVEATVARVADPMGRLKSLLKEKQYDVALREAEVFLADQPRHVGLLSAAASAAFALGRNQEALQFIRRALYIQPDSSVLKESLNKIQRRIDETEETS